MGEDEITDSLWPGEEVLEVVPKPLAGATVYAFGDLTLDRGHMRRTGINYESVFGGVDGYISKADIFFCNLEGPITSFSEINKDKKKKYTFYMPPDRVESLLLGLSGNSKGQVVFNLANNHTARDFGLFGLNNTKSTLDKCGIGYCGSDANANPHIEETKGLKIAFLGYAVWYKDENMFKKIEQGVKNAKKSADVVIVNFHWGREKEKAPKRWQVELAHRVIDAGASAVLGGHSHVIQGVEEYTPKIGGRPRPIFYSLGNFIFSGNYYPGDRHAIGVNMLIDKNGVRNYRVLPIITHPERGNFRAEPPKNKEDYDKIILKVNSRTKRLYSDVLSKPHEIPKISFTRFKEYAQRKKEAKKSPLLY